MSKAPAPNSVPSKAQRARAFTTSTVISFSLTLLAGSIVVLANVVPLKALTFGERIDVGAVLFLAPVVALVLAVIFEATRIALRREPLPEPRQRQVVRNWTPGHREG